MGCFPAKVSPEYHEVSEEKGGAKPSPRELKLLRGDVTQRYEARKMREEKLRQRQLRITSAAEELSSRVMEERETLSINSKSRATSRNTSRAGSPSLQKKQVTFNTVYNPSPRSEVSQVAGATDGVAGLVPDSARSAPLRTVTNGNAQVVT
ncbi:uncharacterized protein LOC143289844 [Babylonia areolata]|uniref:uncharacterized protein LOC143289844 n=1 Tax=Babylonia areolata TaxID=304850 RepID=UPI003FD1E13B